MACHHIRETSAFRQRETRPPPPPTARSTDPERCLPKTTVDAPDVRPWDGRVNASADATLDQTVDVSLPPSPHLSEVLRQPIESTLASPIRVMQPFLTGTSVGNSHSQSITYQLSVNSAVHRPTNNLSGVKNSDRRSELLPKEKAMGASAPKPLLAIHPQPKAGPFWLFPVKISYHGKIKPAL